MTEKQLLERFKKSGVLTEIKMPVRGSTEPTSQSDQIDIDKAYTNLSTILRKAKDNARYINVKAEMPNGSKKMRDASREIEKLINTLINKVEKLDTTLKA